MRVETARCGRTDVYDTVEVRGWRLVGSRPLSPILELQLSRTRLYDRNVRSDGRPVCAVAGQ